MGNFIPQNMIFGTKGKPLQGGESCKSKTLTWGWTHVQFQMFNFLAISLVPYESGRLIGFCSVGSRKIRKPLPMGAHVEIWLENINFKPEVEGLWPKWALTIPGRLGIRPRFRGHVGFHGICVSCAKSGVLSLCLFIFMRGHVDFEL